MTSKKWLCMFASTVLAVTVLLVGFNLATDPFGVFGDRILGWDSYNATNNPRTAKIGYLDRHRGEYDSFIIGCSSTSSFTPQSFEKYTSNKYYNLIVYGADMLDSEQMAKYVIEEYGAREIILNVYIDNAINYADEPNEYTHSMLPKLSGESPIQFYSRYLFLSPEYGVNKLSDRARDTFLSKPFDVFDMKTGTYDKRKRDIEPISDMESYLKAYPVFADYPQYNSTMPNIDACTESIGRIVEMCREADVKLTVVTAPIYKDRLMHFQREDIIRFYSSIAKVTDFWDFSYSSVSAEPRYFYDETHFRSAIGEMAAARIYSDSSVYVPADFGYYVTKENAEDYFAHYFDTPSVGEISAEFPILMYHHIDENVTNDMIVTPATFESHIKALAEAGYTSVFLSDLVSYAEEGTPLPDKPIVITFDDGYMSNYTHAFPILKKYGMKATIFAVGSSIGRDTYKDTGEKIIPHFGDKEIDEMINSGVIEVQSHTFDMHQSESFGEYRTSVSPLGGERESDYLAALKNDAEIMKSVLGKHCDIYALAYPHGITTDNASVVLKESGIKVTLSTVSKKATVVKGLSQSLCMLPRFTVTETSAASLLDTIK